MSHYFRIAAGSIFCLLALLHAIYTPSGLAPIDRAVAEQMKSAGLRLAKGRTNMWDAWVGFNFSHALGAAIFGLVCIFGLAPPWALVLVSAIYLVLAIRYWFRVPAIGIGIATACLAAYFILALR